MRLEKDLIRKLRRQSLEDTSRIAMGKVLGVADEEILRDLQALGYDEDTVVLLHLVPLLQVAWSDGSVSTRERELILEAALQHRIRKGDKAYDMLAHWLERSPSQDFFEKANRVMRGVVHALSPEEAKKCKENLVDFSTRVAQASGRFLGFGDGISSSERAVLEQLAAELQSGHESASKKLLDEM